MSIMNDKQKADAPLSPHLEASVAFGRAFPNIQSYFKKRETDLVRLSIKRNDHGEVFAVLVVLDDEGGPQVCFGNGGSVFEAFGGLNRSIAAGRWRPDRPRK